MVFIKRFRLKNNNNPKVILENVEIFETEVPKSAIAHVPSREDDDSYMIDYCMTKQAIVVSNDQFRDHEEKFEGDAKQQFVKWRNAYRCGYTFALDEFFPSPSFSVPSVAQSNIKSRPISTKSDDTTIVPWLEKKLQKKIPIASLSQFIMKEFGVDNPREAILKQTGTKGKTVRLQLDTIFGERLGVSEDGHKVWLIDSPRKDSAPNQQTQPTSSISEMTDEIAISTILDILEVPSKVRNRKSKWLGWLNPWAPQPQSFQINYAALGHHFKEITGQKLKDVFSSPQDMCQRIEIAYPGRVTASFGLITMEDDLHLTFS